VGGDAGVAGCGVNIQDIFGDLCGDLFGGGGGGGRRRGAARGADLRYHLEVKFEDAAFGIEKEITVPRLENCGTCTGTGAKSGTQPSACGTCGGMGEIRVSQGFFSIARTCHVCGGSGRVVKDPCDDCEGRGQIELEREMTVKIPPGVGEGTRLRLVGEGEAGRGGGPRGDLYVVLTIEPHPLFTREDDSVLCDLPLSFVQATLGTSLEVPTLDGRVKLKVPAGTQPGTVFRLRGKGIPHLRANTRGDQLVTVNVEVPRKLNAEQQSLLEKFAESSGEDVNPEHKRFLDKRTERFEQAEPRAAPPAAGGLGRARTGRCDGGQTTCSLSRRCTAPGEHVHARLALFVRVGRGAAGGDARGGRSDADRADKSVVGDFRRASGVGRPLGQSRVRPKAQHSEA